MKVKESSLKNGEQVLTELDCLVHELNACYYWLTPFGKHDRSVAATLPQYLGLCRMNLKAAKIDNFEVEYPNIAVMVGNGRVDNDGMQRFFDAIYTTGKLKQALQKRSYMVKLETDCEELQSLAAQAIGDFAIFTITQFGLMDSVSVQLCVTEYCSKKGISADVLLGEWLDFADSVGAAPYGYESISKYNAALLDMDPVLLAECEEAGFPLTEKLSKDFIDGCVTASDIRAKLTKFLAQTEEVVVDGVTTGNILERMSLK